jgi:ADP-heptose:LPS heptosyltransferase
MSKILILNTHGIGDVILTLPLLNSLREGFKNDQIDVVVKSTLESDIVMASTDIDKTLLFYRESMRFKDYIVFLAKLVGQYKMLIATSNINHRGANILGKFCFIKHRVGHNYKNNCYSIKVPFDHPHKVDNNLEIAKILKCPIHNRFPQVNIPQSCQFHLSFSNIKKRPVVAIQLGTGRLIAKERFNFSVETFKELPLSFFIKLIKYFKSKVFWVFVGGKREEILYQALKKHLSKSDDIHNFIGRSNILQTASILQQVDMLIAADSGLSHLAAAVNTHVLAIFGPTNPEITGPVGKHVITFCGHCTKAPCYPDSIYHCSHFEKDPLLPTRLITKCMMDVDINQVTHMITNKLAERYPSFKKISLAPNS